MKNIAYLAIDDKYPEDIKPYYIMGLDYTSNPNNIPDGCSLVPWADITFSVIIGPVYYWNSVENAVVRISDGVPLYLIGDFYKK